MKSYEIRSIQITRKKKISPRYNTRDRERFKMLLRVVVVQGKLASES